MSDRLPIHALDPADGTPGQVPTINAAGDAFELADPTGGGSTTGDLLTTSLNGNPELVWDDNDNLVYAEGPTA